MAEMGKPEATPLAVIMMSGVAVECWWPQNLPVRPTPACTSSKISWMPYRSARSRNPSMKAGGVGR